MIIARGEDMNFETIIFEKQNHIGILTLNRPDQLNAFTTAMARDTNQALSAMDSERDIRVVVLKGNGRAFCAGIDVSVLPLKGILEYRPWLREMEKAALTISHMVKPVIVAAHGVAAANGAGLVAAADLAIAAEGTRIGTTAINVGLFCMGPAVPLSRCLGRKLCLEMLFTGEFIDAERAERIGLVNKVVPGDKLVDEAMNLAAKLASKSPVALQMGKKAFYTMSDMEYEKALEYSGEMFAELCTTEDALEGVRAFKEKREPVWKLQ
jgi:enoyl-CoA hydratase/carnithine racemase